MRRVFPIFSTAALLVVSISVTAFSQDIGPIPLTEGSKMVIDGTSNQSDWSVQVTDLEGSLWLKTDGDTFEPDSVYFRTSGSKLESGKSPIMDRLMHRALKVTEHPDITYALGPSGIQRGAGAAADTMLWHTLGTLELAGVSDTLYAIVSGHKDGDRFVFEGAHRMSMRQHGITPPTAMFGALHTSEWVTIMFELVFAEER